MAAIKIKAIVIESSDYEDYGKIVKVFCPDFGLISFLALGVNKPTSKNRYSIQSYSLSEFEIFKARNIEKISKLKTGILKKNYFNIALNWNHYIYTCVMFKILEQIGQINEKHKNIFNMLAKCLENINQRNNAFVNYLFFITHLMQESVQPLRLSKCSRCRKKNIKLVRFEYSENGLVCYSCLWPGEKRQPNSFIELLKNINNCNFFQNIEKKFNYTDLIALHNIIIYYYENFLGFYLGPIYLLKDTASFNLNENIQKFYK